MKKFLGVVYRIFGGFVAVSVLWQIPNFIKVVMNPPGDSTNYNIGYLIGQAMALLMMGAIAYFLWKIGGKKLKEHVNEDESIDANL